ncbi:MAG TPA: serine/threonine-protein kinase [Pirellulales bacterium]|nr:serine/threonine-protein kinase [Pirellulales bacterium]
MRAMAFALETFVKQLEDSGIVAPGKLENFVPPKAHPKDAEELARQLISQNILTKFQTQHVLQNKAKALFLGNYTIVDRVGAGGMGQVFKAEHRRMHRVVAIKMLPPAMTKNAAALARFEREVTAASQLLHPNIVSAFDADEANGAHFLVMEYVEGKDLSVLVKKSGPLPVPKALNYVLQAARGLEFAHRKGVVHRDIKPANLLVDAEGTLKILDMGLARLDASVGVQAGPQAELTGTGTIMGTVDYMSPEQAFNTKSADARADIYSLGCTLYYLIAGKAAYSGDSIMEKLLAHREMAIPALRAVQPEVPEELDEVFQKMMAKKVEDRYQTMTEVVAELEKCQAGFSSPRASSTAARSSTGPTVADADLSIAFQHTPLPLIPSGFADVPPERPKKRRTAAKQSPPPWKNRKLLIGAGAAGFLLLLAGVIFMLRTKDGTLVIEVNQPDAVVQVLDEEGKVEVSQPGGLEPVSISVVPGKHRIRVEKNGFVAIATEFEIQSGQSLPLKARLVPKPKQVAAGPNKPWETPAFQQWTRAVAAMPAEQQVEAVGKKLMELNPGFDGKLTGWYRTSKPKIENRVVTEFGFVTDNVTDISPVRALVGLRWLSCSGSGTNKGQLSDLSPLDGMPLVDLNCSDTRVSDLSVLRGMPLRYVFFKRTPVTDVSPLEGMTLSELGFSPANFTQGVEVLRRLKIQRIFVDGDTQATFTSAEFWKKYDAGVYGKPGAAPSPQPSPIKGEGANARLAYLNPAFQQWVKATQALPAEQQVEAVSKKLMELNPGFDGKLAGAAAKLPTKIENGVVTQFGFFSIDLSDISPVRALPGLKVLHCTGSSGPKGQGQLSDLSPLKGMQLTSLSCSITRVFDLTPLKGMPLTQLSCHVSQVADLSPLEGMPLTDLNISNTPVIDLSPLKGMRLNSLNCVGTKIADISILRGMPLTQVHGLGSQVSELSPLRGAPLMKLNCVGTVVTDLSPLTGMSLTEISFTPQNIVKGLDIIRQMKSLKTIGGPGEYLPAAEFWKKYDAGDYGKPGVPLLPLGEGGRRPDEGSGASAQPSGAKAYLDPAFQQWVKATQALSAEQQLEAVSKKLMELNPGFDGKLDINGRLPPEIENGVVTRLAILSVDVSDISPVRALPGLKNLYCTGSGPRKGKLSDLSPLHGMQLASFDCGTTHVSDLAPLEGMPLASLSCQASQVADLSPIQGMPLDQLNISLTAVSDLSPLRGMQLKSINFAKTKVTDIAILRGMPLRMAHGIGPQVSDLSPLRGAPLTTLDCVGTAVSDLSPLAGMSLTEIQFTPKNIVQGLDIVRQMKSLKTIGGGSTENLPPAEFWKKYDAGEFGKPGAAPSGTK